MELRPLSSESRRLFTYVQRGDVDSALRELQSGTSVNFIDPSSTDSPLMLACRKGFHQMVQLCLDFGAKNDAHPEFGQTALHAAVAGGHCACAEIILDVAAHSDADHIISNLTDQYGQTPLHCAALMGSVPLAELLLRHGAQLSSVDSYGQTALHLSSGSVNKACLAVLLDHGGDEVIEVPDIYGNRPLHHAVYHGRLECTKLLLETAADVTARNSKNLTPYNLASMQGHHQIGLLLLEYRDHHNLPPSATPTPSKMPFFTPNKNMGRNNFSPQNTPPSMKYDEKEFRTPLTSNKYEIALSINEPPPNIGNSLGVPEFRRNHSNEMVGLHLPRPHTVGSPSINNKALSTKKKNSKLPFAVSSPTENMRKNSDSSMSETNVPVESNNSDDLDFRVVPQLTTPLFSRDVSNRTASSYESYEQGVDNTKLDEQQDRAIAEDSFPYYTSAHTPSKEAAYYEYEEHNNYGEPNDIQYTQESEASQSEPYDGNGYDDNSELPATPRRKADVDPLETQESQFADPLEIFSWCERQWHVYMTEQSDIYYLDMEHNHSQWEDPRIHGLISMTSYFDLPPESPSKLSDTAPPLSPALRSPSHMSPSVSLPGSAIKSDTELKRVARAFQKVFTFDGEADVSTEISSPSAGATVGIASVRSPSTSDDDENTDILVRNIAKRNVRRNFENKNKLFNSPERPASESLFEDGKPSQELEQDKKNEPKKQVVRRGTWISEETNVEKQQTTAVTLPQQSVVVVDVDVDTNVSEKSGVVVQANQDPSIGRTQSEFIDMEECQEYVKMINEGTSLHDVRILLETNNRSSQFIMKVLALADDLVILDEHADLSEDAFCSPKSKDTKDSKLKTEEQKSDDEVQPAISLDSLKDDVLYSKYVKMAKMGVPSMSVITKMKMDAVDSTVLSTMQQALGLAPPMKKEEQKKEEAKPKWQPVPEDRLKNSIWAFSAFSQPEGSLLAEQELKDLEQMFLATPAAAPIANPTKVKQSHSLKLLEGKRAQNITIGLVAFKSFGTHVDVIKAICSLNNLGGRLEVDNLENFKNLLPTESEVKKSFLLKNVDHPAEIFIQTALIFYPELPLRLDTFLICLNFNSFSTGLEKRMKIIMDVINQIVSSPKLVKILQKLLVVGKVMLEPNKIKSKSSAVDSKTTVLEQLLQVSNTKGVDKKTSLLDYLVKSLFDKNEENLLEVIEDLAQLGDNTLPLSTNEALHEYDVLQKQLGLLQKELDRVQKPSNDIFSSPTAKAMSDQYYLALESHVSSAKERISYITKRKLLLSKKIRSLMEYFGEDPKNTDNTVIFQALKEFRRALAFSKEAVEWKLSRTSTS